MAPLPGDRGSAPSPRRLARRLILTRRKGLLVSDQPIETYRGTVLPAWIDYNGHMNLAYYLVVFDQSIDAFHDHLDIGIPYRKATNFSTFVLETHLTYARELKVGEPIVVTTQLIDADAKRLHYFKRLIHGTEGYLSATGEFVSLHVELAGPRAAPFPPEAHKRVAAMLEQHRSLPRPPELGRSVGLKPRC
jgi:acyl-CoA thioester hydrolase